jgi:hypothetical protein
VRVGPGKPGHAAGDGPDAGQRGDDAGQVVEGRILQLGPVRAGERERRHDGERDDGPDERPVRALGDVRGTRGGPGGGQCIDGQQHARLAPPAGRAGDLDDGRLRRREVVEPAPAQSWAYRFRDLVHRTLRSIDIASIDIASFGIEEIVASE